MAFRQKVKSALVVGNEATVIIGGMEYSGEVVEFENMTPQDAHVSLKQEDGSIYILPISAQMVIVVPPVKNKDVEKENEVENLDDEDEKEIKAPVKDKSGKVGAGTGKTTKK